MATQTVTRQTIATLTPVTAYSQTRQILAGGGGAKAHNWAGLAEASEVKNPRDITSGIKTIVQAHPLPLCDGVGCTLVARVHCAGPPEEEQWHTFPLTF